ncbi:hypothetical protein [Thiocystis violascens]|uniref:Uncharacterized protein n=1 Tax=Thiocystis violascens (strain ATCC 17096 / DSM 198 / 6111) TaxID=765911 RepID=I3YGU3_THIV6|nr:hypothetical protein [Thiocystis violascens]AFL76211.1 hypothetical protein Thivi_4408 [Thiocystis violascens DSM 198]
MTQGWKNCPTCGYQWLPADDVQDLQCPTCRAAGVKIRAGSDARAPSNSPFARFKLWYLLVAIVLIAGFYFGWEKWTAIKKQQDLDDAAQNLSQAIEAAQAVIDKEIETLDEEIRAGRERLKAAMQAEAEDRRMLRELERDNFERKIREIDRNSQMRQ